MIWALSLVNIVVWTAAVAWLSGSLARDLRGKSMRDDKLWSLFCLTGIAQLCYRARFIGGLVAPPAPGAPTNTSIGLLLLTTGIGCGVLWKRYSREGWRL